MSDAKTAPHQTLTVGGVLVDMSDLSPLTIGDKRALARIGVDFTRYARERAIDPDDEAKLVLYLIQKKRPATTEAEVDEIPIMVASSFVQFAMKRSSEMDDPFSTRSTSSGPLTGGASAKSSDALQQS